MYQVRNRCEHLPAEKKDELCFALPDLIARAMNSVNDPDVVDVLVRDLDNDSLETIDRIVRILEILNTEEVVTKLLGGFSHDSRSVRNRCFQALLSIGEKTLAVATWKLKSLGDTGAFGRYNDGTLDEESYYLARNCIDLVSKLGKKDEIQLIKELTDDTDPRIRREVMLNLAKMDPEEGTFLARLRLTDPDPMVIKAAISTLGNLKAEGAEHDLVDLFYAQHDLQSTIVNSLALIGGQEAESLMVGATKMRFGGHLGRIYRLNPELRLTAIKALGQCGTKVGLKALRKFTRRLRNPLLRIFLFPMKSLSSAKELLRAGQDSLSRIEYRQKKPA
jgi:HEAT repeat protein